MKKNYIIALLIFSFLSIAFFLMKAQNYSMLEIDADNYLSKLHWSNRTIFESHIDFYIPDNVSLMMAGETTPEEGKNYGHGFKIIQKQSQNGEIKREIFSSNTGLQYNVFYNGYREAPEQVNINSISLAPEILLTQIINQLILNEGFIKKETILLGGNDILIKETPTEFIVVRIRSNKYRYNEPPTQLLILAYSKKKFFN